MSNFTSILSIICIVLSIAACSSGNTGSTETYDEQATDTSVETTSNPYGDDLPEGIDYDGYAFRVLLHNEQGNIGGVWSAYVEIPEQTGDTLNDAAYRRNMEVEDRLNVTFKACEDAAFDGCEKLLIQTVLARDDAYDYVVLGANENFSGMMTQKTVCDYNKIPYIDLDADYYFRNANQSYAMLGTQYFICGEYTYTMMSGVSILFNKSISESLNLESPYITVDNGAWTFDKMMDYSKDAYNDINGDGKKNKGDMFGIVTHSIMPVYLYSSFGGSSVSIKDGKFEIDIYNEKNQKILEKLIDLYESPNALMDDSAPWESFFSGNALFCYYGSSLVKLRDIDGFDFGFLPSPKFDESQDTYTSYVCGGFTAVPTTVSDTDRTGIIIEALYSASHRYIVDAFLESYVEQKIMRDTESQRMYKLTLANGVYDLTCNIDPSGKVQNYKIIQSLLTKKSTDLASAWSAVEISVTTAFDDLYNQMLTSVG